ncbi:CgeB family protein [Paenibacillus senegalensis]|uniref:CgeB family protein n=1 Tax=Paenibacillus senegalensis TaxID=1465766 RepID=UPI000287BF46|nr:glycosyltransferase [Paenibacillus senegalensis]
MAHQRKANSYASYLTGKQLGYGEGVRDGHHFGKAAVMKQLIEQQQVPHVWNKRVLFVTTGKHYPYSPLDQAITQALQKMTVQLQVAPPTADILPLVNQMMPDLVLVLEGMGFPLSMVHQIREKGIQTAIWLTDDPYYTDITGRLARYYTHVFTLELSCLDFYRQLGCPSVHYLPLGVNPSVFMPKPVDGRQRWEASFIGSGYWNRIHFFNKVLPQLSKRKLVISGWWWDRLKRYKRYRSRIRLGTWMGPEQTASFYSGSQIVINLHRSPDDESYNLNGRKIPALSVNPRTFEIAACAAFQLSDERADLASLYVPGEEMVTYSSPEDFLAKVDHYLRHPEERSRIALRAMQRTLRDHTYEARLQRMFEIVFPEG